MFINKSNWKKSLLEINNGSIIKDAINSLNESGMQILLIVDKNEKLIGTITDGDVRRGLLKGKTLNSNLRTIINKKPLFIDHNNNPSKKKLKNYNSFLVPVLNKYLRVIGIKQFVDDLKPQLESTLIIMAGGKGQRLKSLTKKTPKPMLLFNKKPLLEHIITSAKKQGIYNYIISVNYLADKIKKYFKNGNKYGIDLTYVQEKQALGTAGSLSLIKNLNNNPYIIINGDVLTNVNFKNILNFHLNSKADITIGIISYEYQIPYGVIETNGQKFKSVNEKPFIKNFINAGVYVFNKNVFSSIEYNKKIDMTDLLVKLKKNKYNIKVFPIHENWIDIGLPKDFKNLKNIFND